MKTNANLHELIMNAMPGNYLILAPDIPHFTILAASDAYLEVTQTSREEITGKGAFEVFPDNPDDPETRAVDSGIASFTKVVKEKCVDIMGLRRYDIRLPLHEGGGFKTKYWKPVNTPVLGPDGQVVCIIHQIEDVIESMLSLQNVLELQSDALSLREARAAALNIMQDAILAREKALQMSEQLMKEIVIRKNAEEKYRNLFETMIEGFCIIEVIFDENENPIDYRFLEINPVFEIQTGLQNARGKLMSELAPVQEPYWYEIYGRIALTGVPERFENEAKTLGKWFEVSAYRIGEPDERKVAILFNDITERKLLELHEKREARKALVLSELSKIFSESVFNLQEVADIMAKLVSEYIGDMCIITQTSEDGEWLLPISHYHADLNASELLKDVFPNVRIRVGEGSVGKAALTGQAVRVSGIPKEQLRTMIKPEFWHYLDRYGVFDYMIVPFKTEGIVVGTIGVMRTEPGCNYTSEDQEFLEILAGRAALGISNNRLYNALQQSHTALEQKVLERTSELKKTMNDLSIEQKRFREVLDILPSYVALMDQDHKFTFTNQEFLKRFGDAKGKRCYEYLFERTKPCPECHFDEVLQTSICMGWEWEGPDGLTYDVSEIPFTDVDGSKMILKIGSDVTDLKHAEKDRIAREVAEQANQAKSEFLANISHEIRTPMNAIIGFSELLMNSVKDEKQWSQVTAIRSSSRNLLALINDILDLSKIEAGKMVIQPEPVNFSSLIADIEKVIDQRAQAKGIRFFIELEKQVPQILLLDEYRMRQILFNLLDNAVKFTDEGQVIMVIDRVMKSGEKVDLVISIEDSGIGIPENQQNAIFYAFNRQMDLPEKKYEGTGLGLTITLRLVELMGGTIKLNSQPGKGSAFTVYLPDIQIMQTAGLVKKDKVFDIRTIHFNKAKILIADDNFENRKLLVDILAHSPLELIEAANGKEAFDLSTMHLPDLILMDLRMPEMSGYQATKLLKHQESTKNIPVIAISASPKIVLNDQYEKDIFDDFIMKPVIIADLAELLKKYLLHRIPEKDDDNLMDPAGRKKQKLTKEQNVQVKDLIRILEIEFFPVYQEALSRQMIGKIEQFGHDLAALGRKYGSDIVMEYGQSIGSYAESFNVDLLMEKLKLFPEIIIRLKKQTSA